MSDGLEDAARLGQVSNALNLRNGKNNNLVSFEKPKTPKPSKPNDQFHTVGFDRRELNLLLRTYGFKVAGGEWRDYAIDMLKERAVFSVFRRSSEVPLYSIEKMPKLARRQGAYSVTNASGQILKRGHDLVQVLKIFEKKTKLAAI